MTLDVLSQVECLGLSPSSETALAALAEPLRLWFQARHATPTPAQRLAWPSLLAGKHLLLAAPTGSGKTLAAFLPILQDLMTGPLAGAVRCLYVAPLKALLTDVRKNLRAACHGLSAFLPGGHGGLRIGVRTGDTSARSRRQQRCQPPDVLLTTPESLAVLLSQPASGTLFGGLHWVIVDEVHALAATKRGADLAVSLERLEVLAGTEPRRVGLSATCGPLDEAARFLVGAGRRCVIAHVADTTPLQLHLAPLPVPSSPHPAGGGFVNTLVDRLEPEVRSNRSTLVFANTRGLAERLSWALRRRCPDLDEQVAVHHSSLAPVRRRRIEQRLKRGRLRAVVTSTSLELGIDIGSVDLVVLVHPPGGVVRLLQRVGRSGHAPAGVRRGLVLTATAAELLEAAVTAACGRSAQCEPLRVPPAPLDVLCQQLLGMAAARPWSADEAFELVRRAYPYRNLDRREFEDCLHYLSGRPARPALPEEDADWLPPRLRWDEDAFTLRDARTARLVRRNLGTILAEEPCPVLLEPAESGGPSSPADDFLPSPVPVGHVDEAFADGLQPGDRFLLDGRCLEFRQRDGGALLVREVVGRPTVPRWAGDAPPLSAELARRLYLLRLQAREALQHGPDALRDLLGRDYALPDGAAAELVAYFQRQECVSEVPDAATCLVEAVHTEAGSDHYVHTPLNRPGNDALARVAVLRLARDHGLSATSLVADLGFALLLRAGADLGPEAVRSLLAADGFEADLDAALAGCEVLRERFRRSAVIGLMLLRNPLGPRRRVGGPDWAERRLFEQVRAADPDFVLLRQARREVRAEVCDLGAARGFVEGLPRLRLCCRRLAQPSPFVEEWTQLAAGPVESVEGPEEALRRLHAALTSARAGEV
jgi:ATP-dependent Lhr-like helicase